MQMQSSIYVHIDAETYIYIDMLAFADTFANNMQLAHCILLRALARTMQVDCEHEVWRSV